MGKHFPTKIFFSISSTSVNKTTHSYLTFYDAQAWTFILLWFFFFFFVLFFILFSFSLSFCLLDPHSLYENQQVSLHTTKDRTMIIIAVCIRIVHKSQPLYISTLHLLYKYRQHCIRCIHLCIQATILKIAPTKILMIQ